jgi:DNA-directed RNA polymerase alpha subunit
MKKKQNTQNQVCSYILEQLMEKANCRLSKNEIAAFRIFWETQDYQLTAYKLDISSSRAIKLVQVSFQKLNVRKTKPTFETEEDFLLSPIFIHPFSTRVFHVLRFMDCNNLAELLNFTRKELMGKRGFGRKALSEIKDYLENSEWEINYLIK